MNSDQQAPAGHEAPVATTQAASAPSAVAAPVAGAGEASAPAGHTVAGDNEPVKRRRASKAASAESADTAGEAAVPAVRRTRKPAAADAASPESNAGTDLDAAERAAIAAALREQAAAAAAAKRPARKSTRKKADAVAAPEGAPVDAPVDAPAREVGAAPADSAAPSAEAPVAAAQAAVAVAQAPVAVAASPAMVADVPAATVAPGVNAQAPQPVADDRAPARAAVVEEPARTRPAAPADHAEPTPAQAAAAEGDPATAVPAQADAPVAGDDGGRPEGSRRQRDRARRRERNAEADGAPAGAAGAPGGAAAADAQVGGPAGVFVVAPPEPSVLDQVDVADRYADVVSGSYDVDEAPAAETAEAADPGKRVLRPEPEAPKLHKVLAQAGIGSRRDMEELIADGRVTVNGEVAHLGMRITYGDQIKVGGKPVKYRIAPPAARVLAYHKPVGEVVTHHDPEGRPTVFRQLPRLPQGKWLSVGRLDINTEGLLLFTNSGDLAHQLMHPKFGVDREYAVRVLGTLNDEARARLLEGVEIDGQKAAFKSIDLGAGEGANHWYRVVIGEGRNREVRKLFDSVGLGVSRLIRIRYGQMVLPRGLKRGVWVELSDQDVAQIRQFAGLAGGQREGERGGQRDGFRGEGQGQRPQRDDAGGKQRGNKPGQQGQQQRFQGGQGGANGPQGGQRGGQGQQRPQQGQGGGGWGQGPEGQRGPKPGRKGQQGGGAWGNDRPQQERFERRDDANARGSVDARDLDDLDDDRPLRIPNPLEQTFDRRFATGSKRITSGFGRPSDPAPDHGPRGGPKQPDPMQTSVGYIGADAYFTRPGGGNKNRGGRRR